MFPSLLVLQPICVFSVADTVKPEAHLVVWVLRRRLGLKVALMTGDNERAALAIGRSLGIKQVRVVIN